MGSREDMRAGEIGGGRDMRAGECGWIAASAKASPISPNLTHDAQHPTPPVTTVSSGSGKALYTLRESARHLPSRGIHAASGEVVQASAEA